MAKGPELAPNKLVGPLGLYSPPDLSIECAAFTGSLGLLFQCVRDHKVDLLDVPLAPICAAYLEYLLGTSEADLEESAVGAAALAYLLEKKSSALLPSTQVQEEEEFEETVIEGANPTISYFSPALRALESRLGERENLFFRQTSGSSAPYEIPFDLGDVKPSDLARALDSLLARATPTPFDPLGRPRRSLAEQMDVVMAALTETPETLDKVVVGEFTRAEAVWWFLALLELIRLGLARVTLQESEPCFFRTQP